MTVKASFYLPLIQHIMTKAEALALLEYNAQPNEYISSEEFDRAFREAIESKSDADYFTKSSLYNSEIRSFVYNKMRYTCICIMRQDWTGDWYDDSTVYFKQRQMTHEEMISLMSYIPGLQDFDVE
jgi:hypothetical protein